MSEAPTDQVLGELLAETRIRPSEFALLCDLDGTLAPIVTRPEEVEVPERTRQAVAAAARNLGLCAIVTGRPAKVAAELIDTESIVIAGNHGLELLEPESDSIISHSLLADHERDAAGFLASLEQEEISSLGIRIEDKGPIVALHWRGIEESDELLDEIERISSLAREAGLDPRGGRMVLELRPRVEIDKGVAVTELIASRPEIDSAIFIGDDATDLDAFEALETLSAEGRLVKACKISVTSEETTGLALAKRADICLSGPAEVADLIAQIGA